MSVPGADIEVVELTDHLARVAPFDRLAHAERVRTARQLEVIYATRNQCILEVEADNTHLFFVRKGAVELTDADERLVERLGEDELFGYPSLIGDGISMHRAIAIEDTLLYRLPGATFDALRRAHPWFATFFEHAHAQRLHAALRERADGAMLAATVRTLLTRAPVTASPQTTIQGAAVLMSEQQVSSLLVLEDEQLVGVLTDRDFRARVVSKGLDLERPISDVMTHDPVCVQSDSFVLEALFEMSRHNIRHLPVVDEGRTIGMITTTDLMRQQAASPVHLVSDVFKQQDVSGLSEISKRVPRMVRQMMDADARSEDVGRMVTAVVDALTQQLIALAEAELGPAPAEYCWVALGSQARQEQTAHSDQDNAL
ncbi:MAG: CBS domain-containing protein, partial [Myxococcota bacterium]